MKNKMIHLFSILTLSLFAGCAIKNGPEYMTYAAPPEKPIVRVGEVTETPTGTWAVHPSAGIKGQFLEVLRQAEPAQFFGGDLSSLTMNIHLTTDHVDDGPRLTSLGMLSLVTIGVIPLPYHSEWNVDCTVTLVNPEGQNAAQYKFHEKGTYDIWAFPPTMFALFGAGIRGENDGRDVFKRISNNLVDKIMKAVEKDYSTLAGRAAGAGAPGTFAGLQQNVIV